MGDPRAAVLKTRFFTLDFALLETGELTVVKANPRGALVGLYAQVLQRLADRPLLSADQLYELAETLKVDFWKEDEVFGLFPL